MTPCRSPPLRRFGIWGLACAGSSVALSLLRVMKLYIPNMMPPRPALWLFALAFACSILPYATAQSGLVELRILPSNTDPAIQTFDQPHVIRLNRDIVVERKPGLPAPRGQLLLFLPGTVPPAATASSTHRQAAPAGITARRARADHVAHRGSGARLVIRFELPGVRPRGGRFEPADHDCQQSRHAPFATHSRRPWPHFSRGAVALHAHGWRHA